MFKEENISEMQFKISDVVNNMGTLITAGNLKDHNTMTATWGGIGQLWDSPVATLYVRPQRYTREFLDREKFFTTSFFSDQFKDILKFCGTNSGRNVNKDEKTGLTPKIFGESVAYEEAELVFVCEKQYRNMMEPENILDEKIIKTFYDEQDFHIVYIGKIVQTFLKQH